MKLLLRVLVFTVAAFIVPSAPAGADEVRWEGIRPYKVTMYYPGYSSFEFLTSEDHRLGARNIKRGEKSCRRCHLSKRGELDLAATEIASGKAMMKRSRAPLEDEPIAGKKGVLSAYIQAAYDSDYIYFRVSWSSKGTGWHDASPPERGIPDRVSFQINSGNDLFKRFGCSITCHSDLSGMPRSPSAEEVRSHPYYSRLGRDEVRLYADYTRLGGWDKLKSPAEIRALKEAGALIDLWSIEIQGGRSTVRDGWILEDRRWEGSSDLTGSASWKVGRAGRTGRYSAIVKRRLATSGPTDVPFVRGEALTLSLAIHDHGAKKRKHYVSFPMTVGLGAKADIEAREIVRK